MDNPLIDGVLLTPLREIETPGGNVFHGMKCADPGYAGFGEAYFSTVEPNAIKPWKRHKVMTLNLIVPIGRVRFVLYDDRRSSGTSGITSQIIIGRKGVYGRLTVPPCVWMAFQGCSSQTSWVLNIANVSHDPTEADRLPLDAISFDWEMKS